MLIILISFYDLCKAVCCSENQNGLFLILGSEVILLKEWKCVLVGHHYKVGKTITEWEKAGWRLHTYTCAGNAAIALGTNRYLLFKKGE